MKYWQLTIAPFSLAAGFSLAADTIADETRDSRTGRGPVEFGKWSGLIYLSIGWPNFVDSAFDMLRG